MNTYCKIFFLFKLYPKEGIGPNLFKDPSSTHFVSFRPLTITYFSFCYFLHKTVFASL